MKVCNRCGEEKPLSDFYTRTVRGKVYPATVCKICQIATRPPRPPRSEADRRSTKKANAKLRHERANGINIHQHIWDDSRQSDRRHGRPNDLTKEFIREMIIKPCLYCDDTASRMTLDRIDNSGGHTQDNVVQACYRCNHTRGNMPFEAWKLVAPGMKAARLAGAFNGWGEKPFAIK